MKIEYRTPPGDGDYSTLADEGSTDRISGFQPALRKRPQTEALAFSDSQFVQDRGNAEFPVRFVVDRVHTDPDAAASFIATHLAVFAGTGNFDLKVTIGATVVTLGNCAVTEVSPSPHSDKSTVFSYAFVGTTYG